LWKQLLQIIVSGSSFVEFIPDFSNVFFYSLNGLIYRIVSQFALSPEIKSIKGEKSYNQKTDDIADYGNVK